jgi:hypothetical protein
VKGTPFSITHISFMNLYSPPDDCRMNNCNTSQRNNEARTTRKVLGCCVCADWTVVYTHLFFNKVLFYITVRVEPGVEGDKQYISMTFRYIRFDTVI